MEPFVILVVLVLVVVIFVLPIAAFVRSGRAVREAEQLRARFHALQAELARLKVTQEEQRGKTAVEHAVSAAAPPTESPGASLATTLREAREQRPETRAKRPHRRGSLPPRFPRFDRHYRHLRPYPGLH